MGGDVGVSSGPIRVHIQDLKQLFNSMDPSPFVERDLDPEAEEFIVDWAREFAADAPLAIVIEVREPYAAAEELAMVREALTANFQRTALATARRLRRLLADGRLSLVIGVAVLAACLTLSAALSGGDVDPLRALGAESLIIGGWVAMWRPMEIFLYAWWPVARDLRLFRRLATARVDVTAHDGRAPAVEGAG